jgi:hypothetical protein
MPFARFLILLSLFTLTLSASSSARDMESFPVVKLQSLDKITARTMTFEANVGNTVKFGSLYIKIQACKKASPVEQPESAAFLQIWEVRSVKDADQAMAERTPPKEESKWIFSGWMFASSPALSHMDHPVYDVWVLDCLAEKGGKKAQPKPVDAEPGEGEIPASDAPTQPTISGEQPAAAPAETPTTPPTPVPPATLTAPTTETPPGAAIDVAPVPEATPQDPTVTDDLSPLGD